MIKIYSDWKNYEVFLKKGRNLKLSALGMICYYLGIIKSVDTNQFGLKFDLGNSLLWALTLLFVYSSIAFYQSCNYEIKTLEKLCKEYLRIFKLPNGFRKIESRGFSFLHHLLKPLFISFPIKKIQKQNDNNQWIDIDSHDCKKLKNYISRRAALYSLKDIFIYSIAGSEFLLPWSLALIVSLWGLFGGLIFYYNKII